jgi:hypothetical protein
LDDSDEVRFDVTVHYDWAQKLEHMVHEKHQVYLDLEDHQALVADLALGKCWTLTLGDAGRHCMLTRTDLELDSGATTTYVDNENALQHGSGMVHWVGTVVLDSQTKVPLSHSVSATNLDWHSVWRHISSTPNVQLPRMPKCIDVPKVFNHLFFLNTPNFDDVIASFDTKRSKLGSIRLK